MFHGVLVTCRPGFEKECAAELGEVAHRSQIAGFARTVPESGFCIFQFTEPLGRLESEVFDWKKLIFARSVMCLICPPLPVPEQDRISPILEVLKEVPNREKLTHFLVESSDSNEGREFSAFCRSFSKPLRAALHKANLRLDYWDEQIELNVQGRCLHVFVANYSQLYVGISAVPFGSPWPRGIVRLKFPGDAPSRSTLKLEEAFMAFLSEDERASALSPSRRAVDLGACPGGWTYQFVRRGIRTIAVDNGSMDEKLMESGLVEHLRVDGFKFVPSRPVDWMVCDMVEQPKRVAELALYWWQAQSAKRLIFNLKLPMKKRWPEVQDIRTQLEDQLRKSERPFRLLMKHLYHDREEITVYLGPLS